MLKDVYVAGEIKIQENLKFFQILISPATYIF
jgi:hypothetical protein